MTDPAATIADPDGCCTRRLCRICAHAAPGGSEHATSCECGRTFCDGCDALDPAPVLPPQGTITVHCPGEGTHAFKRQQRYHNQAYLCVPGPILCSACTNLMCAGKGSYIWTSSSREIPKMGDDRADVRQKQLSICFVVLCCVEVVYL